MPITLVCDRCGRKGSRGFILDGQGGTACDSRSACQARERRAEATYRAAWTGKYRCGECGHGRYLEAWAVFLVHGPLGLDGQIDSANWEEQDILHEDSIQCTRHVDGPVEICTDGRWYGWWSCPFCYGRGEVTVGESWSARKRPCLMDGVPKPGGDGKQMVHRCWWPLDMPWPAPTLDRAGHVFTPGPDPYCRRRRAPAGSIAGREQCDPRRELVGHQCPAVVPQGATATATQTSGGGDLWFCWQPGTMNDDFTEWRCDAGHATTWAGHVPPGTTHEDTCPAARFHCPWDFFLSPELDRQNARSKPLTVRKP